MYVNISNGTHAAKKACKKKRKFSVSHISRTITYTTYLAQLRGQHRSQRTATRCARIAAFDVYVPRGLAVEALVRRITSPQALDQHGSGGYLTIEVLLALFLLHFKRKSGAEYALCEKCGVNAAYMWSQCHCLRS